MQRKISAKILLFSLVAGLLFSPAAGKAAGYDQAAAQSYLSSHSNNSWSTMALSSIGANPTAEYLKTVSGSTALDYSAPILAITSLNQNPRTFGSEDYVAKLKTFHTNSQIGDTTTINDDIFALLALIAAGEDISSGAGNDAKNFILNNQGSDGGWGFSVGGSSDSNMTSTAIVALKAAGVSPSDNHIQNGLEYLKTAQNDDGGFTYDPHSSYGTASDSSSTAWVLWALNSLGVDQNTWSKNGNSPRAYLESQQHADGWFKYQSNSTPDAFSTTTTAYVVIALAGKSLPIKTVANTGGGSGGGGSDLGSNLPYSFRIEGSSSTVCEGKTDAPTALEVIKKAATTCGFQYHIKETSFGPYLDRIGEDLASGSSGWMYLVNYNSPSVGAADYSLQTGDNVLWFFGPFDALPTRISISNPTLASGQSFNVTVESFSNNSWSPLSGATVYAGLATATTDTQGHASLSAPDGYYKVYAEKAGYVRTNTIGAKIGEATNNAVNLSVNYQQGTVLGSSIGFTVTPSNIDFGTISNGGTSERKISLINTGSTNVNIEARISGDAIYNQNLSLSGSSVGAFKTPLAQSIGKDINLKLSIPQSYSSSNGSKKGQLTFWAVTE